MVGRRKGWGVVFRLGAGSSSTTAVVQQFWRFFFFLPNVPCSIAPRLPHLTNLPKPGRKPTSIRVFFGLGRRSFRGSRCPVQIFGLRRFFWRRNCGEEREGGRGREGRRTLCLPPMSPVPHVRWSLGRAVVRSDLVLFLSKAWREAAWVRTKGHTAYLPTAAQQKVKVKRGGR